MPNRGIKCLSFNENYRKGSVKKGEKCDMDKQNYYVSIHGRSVLSDEAAAPYEWVIHATHEQAEEVQQMMEDMEEHSEDGVTGYMFPWPDTPEAATNANFQHSVNGVYEKIYEYGTEDTRRHLANFGIIDHS